MKKVLIGIFALGLISCGDSSTEETAEAGNACKPQTEIQFATIEDEVSYAIGFTNAEELKGFLKQPGFEKVIDLSEYLKGYAAVLNKEL